MQIGENKYFTLWIGIVENGKNNLKGARYIQNTVSAVFQENFLARKKIMPWAGMVGTVGKIFAFRPQGPKFDPGSAKIRIFV